ncbi:angiopoietin-1 receptor-like isoform X2 [Glandiceps talaboti]
MLHLLFLLVVTNRVYGRLTLINSSPAMSSTSETHLYCMDTSGNIPETNLKIGRSLDTGSGLDIPAPFVHDGGMIKTVWGREHGDTRYGTFYCGTLSLTQKVHASKVFREDVAVITPQYLSITVNLNEDLTLQMERGRPMSTGSHVVWRHNGNILDLGPMPSVGYVQSYYWTFRNVSSQEGGIYETHPSDNRSLGAITRVIVRGCPSGRWDPPHCDGNCTCHNGGVCDDKSGQCICPPGFMGETCERACDDNKYGENCDYECHSEGCKYNQFCLPDPYGCTCASGWKGLQCKEACEDGKYGPDCKLTCDCQNGGTCDRFKGCICVTGWTGLTCDQGLVAPAPVNAVELIEAGSTTLTIRPNVEPFSGDGPIEQVAVRYKKSVDPKWSLNVIPSTNITFYVLDNLDTDTEYQIRIRLTGNGLTGPQGPRLTASTLSGCQDVPAAPELITTATGSKTIKVSWTRSESDDVLRYHIVYKGEEETQMHSEVVDNVDQSSFDIENLLPYSTYLIGMALENCAGQGPTSPLTSTRTQEDAPGPVQNLRLRATGPDRILVTWDEPLVKNGIIRYYDLQVYANGKPLRDRMGRETEETNYILNGLMPYTNYRVVVQAFTIQSGETVDEETRTREAEPDSPPVNITVSEVTSDSLKFVWDEPEERTRNGIITRYEYIFVNRDDGLHRKVRTTSTRTATFQYLEPATTYSFKIKAYTSAGAGPLSDEIFGKTLPEGGMTTISLLTTNEVTSQESEVFVYTDKMPTTQKGTNKTSPPATKQSTVGLKDPSYGLLDGSLTSAVVMVIGIICGVILILLLACAVCVMFIRTRNKRRRQRSVEVPPVRMSELERQQSSDNDYGRNPGSLRQEQEITLLGGQAMVVPNNLEFWRIPWEKIIFEDNILAEGNFGRVMKAAIKKEDKTVHDVAVKILKDGATDADRKDFIGELEIMCKVGKHPNIVNLVGACEHSGVLYVATEFAEHGNLLNLLRSSRCLETDPQYARKRLNMSTYDSEQLLQFAADVTLGMKHLSDKGCVHRDLAARNILIYGDYVAKVADFGLSRSDEVYVKMTAGRLPVRWMAIESLNYSVYTTKSDVWSFGILLWEIITLGGTPYPGLTCAELYQQLPRGYRMARPLNCEDEVYEIMRHCWRERPYDRPDFGQLYMALRRLILDKKPYVNMSANDNFKFVDINTEEEAAHEEGKEPEIETKLLLSDAASPSPVEC